MPCLLSLPRELRNEIIEYVLLSGECTPSEPDHPTLRQGYYKGWLSDLIPKFKMGWRRLGLERDDNEDEPFKGGNGRPAAWGLTLSSHQVRAETLQRAARVHVPFVADTVFHGKLIVPSWLSRPLCPKRVIPELVLNVRTFNNWARASIDVECLHEYILRFLAVGAIGRMPKLLHESVFDIPWSTVDKFGGLSLKKTIRKINRGQSNYPTYLPHHTVDLLRINVDSAKLIPDDEEHALERSDWIWHVERFMDWARNQQFHGKRFLTTQKIYLKDLQLLKEGFPIWRHIRAIEICFNGSVHARFDMTTVLEPGPEDTEETVGLKAKFKDRLRELGVDRSRTGLWATCDG